MPRTKSILVITVLFFTVSLAFARKVRVDYDHSANFAKYRTFSWIKQPVTPNDPFMQQRIISAVNTQLRDGALITVHPESVLCQY